ncbi:MBL fold metallo-hydrolase [Alkalibacillus haloalkaliphilus]|uniref:MBL fold metallo-hydrolase n=1 Tax=Alkalibacillus haloalkaliphilus TaxID=94136 RepID=UPI0029361BA1|nr:MBL fold metallo-hydrolase [Alkalibacillus haloalkaliphilus]MDV2581991.1 MBL fold metallo-hydrolase [Alkalibacillus haloalkaliphilus]
MENLREEDGMRVVVGAALISALLVLTACDEPAEQTGPSKEAVDEAEKVEQDEDEEASEEENSSKEETEHSTNQEKEVQGELELFYFDVGQADSTLIRHDFEDETYKVLIDTGDWQSSDVTHYLNDLNVEVIDLVIGTHIHADHIGQMDEVIENFNVDEVWMTGNEGSSETYERAITAIETSDVNYHEPRAGEEYEIGSVELEVVHPNALMGDYNEDSISTHLTYGDVAFLFTGDAEEHGEATMLEGDYELSADVLKLGHHGSSSSTTPNFLETVDPQVAVYSAGANNSYGHPHEEVVERVLNENIDLYGTDVNGTVTITTDGESIDVTTQHSGEVEAQDQEVEQQEDPPTSTSECINLNTASNEELQSIVHIGPDRAAEIIDLRPFDAVSEMTQVYGIGDGRLGDIKSEDEACVGGS